MELASLKSALIRVPSKKVFRKWQPATISLFQNSIVIKTLDKPEPFVIVIDSFMRLSEIFEQKGGSVFQSKMTIFFCRLVREAVGAIGEITRGKSVLGPAAFLDDNDTEPVLKFGCLAPEELKQFAKVLDKRLATSPSWEITGRHRIESKTEDDDGVQELEDRYQAASGSPTTKTNEMECKRETSSLNMAPCVAKWEYFDGDDDPFKVC